MPPNTTRNLDDSLLRVYDLHSPKAFQWIGGHNTCKPLNNMKTLEFALDFLPF
jgi:hypothetical protein